MFSMHMYIQWSALNMVQWRSLFLVMAELREVAETRVEQSVPPLVPPYPPTHQYDMKI